MPTHRERLLDGTTMLAVHASLTSDEGEGITARHSDDELDRLFVGDTAQLIVGGHTHDVTDRTVGTRRFVNPGSVSNHPTADKRARYALVDVTATDHRIELRAVEYDVEQAIDAIVASGIPGSGFLLRTYFA